MSVSVTKVLLGVFLLNTVTAAQMICLSGSKCKPPAAGSDYLSLLGVEVTIECVNNSFAQISWTNSNNMYVRLTACGGKDFGKSVLTLDLVVIYYKVLMIEHQSVFL